MAVAVPTNELSPATLAWLEGADQDERKRLGQYMTPRGLRERLLDAVELRPGMRVLDPGVGTGEFLRSVLDREPGCEAFGWDVDQRILGFAGESVPEANLEMRDALDPYQGEMFDLIVGNPPYFQFRANPEIKSRFSQVISGRPNIFALFFQSAIEALADGGRIAFVVPPSMNNGAYFEGLRRYITDNCSIDQLEIAGSPHLFTGAQTAVQIIVLTKGPPGTNHTFTRRCPESAFTRTIFAEDPTTFERAFDGRLSLFELGFEASTGTVVWNQARDRLRSRPGPGTVPLVWARNLRDGKLDLGNTAGRKQYVLTDRRQRGPAIVVNRVVGTVGSGLVRAARIPDGFEFAGENHTNVITARDSCEETVDWDHLLEALMSQATGQRIRLLTGNTQMSATELTHLLPLDPP